MNINGNISDISVLMANGAYAPDDAKQGGWGHMQCITLVIFR